jgi:hypothetical protein
MENYNYNPVVLACNFRSSSSEHKFGAKKPSFRRAKGCFGGMNHSEVG